MREEELARGPAARALSRRLALAWLAIVWERLWPALWPALGIAGTFVALSLLDAWRWLGGWIHLALLVLFALGVAAALWRGLGTFALPSRSQARRRLELKSGLDHRPLALLQDRLASDHGDPGTRGLWRAHRARVMAAVRRLRVGLPQSGLARRDPLGLRALLALSLIVGFSAAGLEWPSRLARAFSPDFSPAALAPAEFDAWIAPPEYTGFAPIVLAAGGSQEALRVPAASNLLARVHGGRGAPRVRIDDQEFPFERVDARTHRITHAIAGGERLALMQGGAELGAWTLEVVPDTPPEVSFAQPPSRTPRSALRIEYEAADDYGLAGVVLRIQREGNAEVLELELPMPGSGLKSVQEASYHDLTPHPWAGLPAVLQLAAVDGIEQEGLSERLEMVLPERIFNHPVARAIIEQRKELTVDPSARGKVARALDALSALPEHFFDDIVVYMALRSARWRLAYDHGEGAIAEIQSLLWDTALRIEDGTLSLAERELREAQQALMEALSRDASDAEIERLMEELRAALDNFLQALAEQAMERAQRGEMEPIDPNTMLMEGEDLKRLLDQVQELSRAGARDAARELLAQLQELLENLRSGLMMGMPQPGEESFGRAMRELGELMRRQQELLDQTLRQSRRGPGAMPNPMEGQPGRGEQGMAGQQESLRRGLGDFMRRLGEGRGNIPVPFGRAERSMLDARRALEEGLPGEAVNPQTQALNELRRGARSLIEEMMERYGELGEGEGGVPRFGPNSQDPLGRPMPDGEWDGGITGSFVEIPDKADLQRAREILQELYRRAGERTRPPRELDYIDRLLRRF